MKLPNKSLERKLFKSGYGVVYGMDEVGMGCLAGPVVVCAVALGKEFFNNKYKNLQGITDSKLLQAKQREKFALELLKIKDIKYKIRCAYPNTIDRLNIYNASREAMRRAIKKLVLSSRYYEKDLKNHNTKYKIQNPKSIVLVDGPHKIPKLGMDQVAITKGDQKVFVIACASIIAKVYRDKMMVRYAKKYPGYGF